MDSLTQIVLGAACGEAVLGKKIGNKALLFGAIGGTIPDLDVFVGRLLYDNEIQAMAFHRGFMHSILFSFIGAFVFGWITYKLYNTKSRLGTTEQKDWYWLYFLALLTHPLLDAFTPYGTQIFAPFSNYRVAFNTISVVDVFYTVPFFISMIVLMFYNRSKPQRRKWLKAGIIISSTYLLMTVFNKIYMNSIFEKSFKNADISYQRFSSQPTILNNFLWYAIAETKNQYHLTFYSHFDESSTAEKIISIDKSHTLLDMTDKDLQTLTWFSNNYFNLSKNEDDTYKYTDLRYPMLNPDDTNTAVFNFTIYQKNNRWDIKPFEGPNPRKEDFDKFLNRIKGI